MGGHTDSMVISYDYSFFLFQRTCSVMLDWPNWASKTYSAICLHQLRWHLFGMQHCKY